ncbi:MAG: CDP-alcohol phosphatidyltransferase [uncultured bacterium]|nr:MAG: CDP-alcohol phosphatidyltransferase [uncultured bacterium]
MPLPQTIKEIKAYQQPHDSIFSRLIYRKISKVLTFYMLRWIPGISAPDVTIISFVVGLLGAVGLMYPAWWARILAFIGIQLSFAFDCSDGEIARMTGRGSKFGIWFDSISDRTKEIVWFFAAACQLYWFAPVATNPGDWHVLLNGELGSSPWIIYLAGAASLGNLLIGYLREAKKSIFLAERKPEIILKSGLHIGTVDVITFLLAFGALFGLNYYVLWIVLLPTPLLLAKQLWSTYSQSNKPNRQSTTALVKVCDDE